MNSHAQVVVIGGGLVGCSILYHLCKLGCTDVILLERDELTSGSTWHAAANIHGLHDDNNISKLQYYTMQLYQQLELETGQGCGVFQPGSLYLAQTREREHQLRIQEAKARYFGVDFRELSRDEAQDMHPLVEFSDIRCVMFEQAAGNVDPSGVTQAYATGARAAGAQIHRFTPVLETNQRDDGGWDVVTDKGTISAAAVVNAAGLWGREVAQLAGIDLPLAATEHQYYVTESMPEVAALGRRLPSVADRDGEYYLRQEGDGMLVGAYEREVRFWAEQGTPLDFGHDLLPDDLARISDNVMRACERIPALAAAGVKRVINGPMIWSPDANALFGPVPELKNYYCCNGIIPGFSQSGGLGLMLAEWIVSGESSLDMFSWDLARFDSWADRAFTKARVQDSYSHRFKIHFPYEERAAGRPARQRPIYDMQKSMGAVFGLNSGWEHPLWFASSPDKAVESYGYERQACFDTVGEECRALRQDAGLIDVSNFAKYRLTGPGCGAWLDKVIANKVPTAVGRSCLSPLLGVRGGIAGDFTVSKLGHEHYMLFGSGMAERYHKRFFQAVPLPTGVVFESLSARWAGFSVAGPRSRERLQALTSADISNEAFPFMRSRWLNIAGTEVFALRVSFTGELGWELYTAVENQLALYNTLLGTGTQQSIRPVGARALLSLRIEKGYGSWGREYSPENWPQEVGLHRLIKTEKAEFLGREAYLALQDKTPREKLVMLSLLDSDADASGGEPIFTPDGTAVGRVTSGSYGHTVEQSLALGFVKTEFTAPGTVLDIAVLGRPHRAVLLAEPPFDARGKRLRS